MNSIFHRISVRKYQAKDVEQEKIEKLLRAAMAAPSACNQQPWEFYVVTNQDVIKALSEASPYAKCAAETPVIFVPCFRSEGIAPEYFNIDLSAAVENLCTGTWRCMDGNFTGCRTYGGGQKSAWYTFRIKSVCACSVWLSGGGATAGRPL